MADVGLVGRGNDAAFDWNRYWSEGPPRRDLVKGGLRMAARMDRFLRSRDLDPKSFSDVGCGPAIMLFELARRYPQCQFYGYDSSRTVLEADRTGAHTTGLANLHFGFTVLPRVPARHSDVVTCMATLHYVAKPMRAIRNLYAMVRKGGYLVFNYPNTTQRAEYRREAYRDPSISSRFALVLAGRNLLSRASVESALGQRPMDFWSAVGEPPNRKNPCVMVARG